MTGNLLDTNTVLIALADPARLPATVRRAVLSESNIMSVISYWEVVLKSMKGSLDVGDPRTWWDEALEQLAAKPLVLRPQHIAKVCNLPPYHKDPFDRILIAQAIAEDLTLVTIDGQIPLYAAAGLRVLGKDRR